MARIRTIKPEFFDDEDLAKLSYLARIAFVGLWTQADREGRLEDRPARLRVRLFPYEESVDMEAVLMELAVHRFVQRYEVDGRALIQIRTFTKHQRPHPKEPPSEYPGAKAVNKNGEPRKETAGRERPGIIPDVSGTSRLGREGDLGERERSTPAAPLSLELASGQAQRAALDLVAMWNARVAGTGLVEVTNSKPSMHRILAAVNARPDLSEWSTVLDKALASDYLMGRVPGHNGTRFRLVFWWLLEDDHGDKVLGGFYDNREKAKDRSDADEAERKHQTALKRSQDRIAALSGGAQ